MGSKRTRCMRMLGNTGTAHAVSVIAMEAFLKGQIRPKVQSSSDKGKTTQKLEKKNVPWVEK